MKHSFALMCLPVGPTEHVICALSGGVDSTVAATLVHQVLGDRLHCIFVDNGLLRYKVSQLVPVVRAPARSASAGRFILKWESRRHVAAALIASHHCAWC